MIKQLIPESICLKCRACCRFSSFDTEWLPCLLNEEIESLTKDILPACLVSSAKKIIPEYSEKNQNYICPLLSAQDNKCKIYSLRPFECQFYPFIINRSNKKIFLAVDLNCPFVEKNLKTEEFNNHILYLTTFLMDSSQKDILKNNPHIIQSYPEVKNLIELILE